MKRSMKRRPLPASSPTSFSSEEVMMVVEDDHDSDTNDDSNSKNNNSGWLFSNFGLFDNSYGINKKTTDTDKGNQDDGQGDILNNESNWKLFDFDMQEGETHNSSNNSNSNMTSADGNSDDDIQMLPNHGTSTTKTKTTPSFMNDNDGVASVSVASTTSTTTTTTDIETDLPPPPSFISSKNSNCHSLMNTILEAEEREEAAMVEEEQLHGYPNSYSGDEGSSDDDTTSCFFGACGRGGSLSTSSSTSPFMSSKSMSVNALRRRKKNLIEGSTNGNETMVRPATTGTMPVVITTAEELANMSVSERNLAYEELHGVATPVKETPSMLEEALNQFQVEIESQLSLDEINQEEKDVYNQAYEMNSKYITNPDLRCMFLRADKFHIPNSVKRFFKLLYWKSKLFGISKVCQDIRYEDLDSVSQKKLATGLFQVLPKRDSCNRAIIAHACSYHVKLFQSAESYFKITYYLIMSCLMDSVETQQHGFVVVFYALGDVSNFINPMGLGAEHEVYMNGPKLLYQALPWRVEAVHFCYSSSIIGPLLGIAQAGLGSRLRSRLRTHLGSPMEVQYELQTYGIDSDLLPYTSSHDYTIKRKEHTKWIARRKAKENQIQRNILLQQQQQQRDGGDDDTNDTEFEVPALFDGIELPTNNDILCGKGKPIQKHWGNRALNDLVELHMNEFDSITNKGQKTVLVQEVVYIVQREYGGRFLKKAGSNGTTSNKNTCRHHGFWIVVTNEEAIEKVFHTFRARREKLIKTTSNSAATVPTGTVSSSSGIVGGDGGGGSATTNKKRQKKMMVSMVNTGRTTTVPSLLERAAARKQEQQQEQGQRKAS